MLESQISFQDYLLGKVDERGIDFSVVKQAGTGCSTRNASWSTGARSACLELLLDGLSASQVQQVVEKRTGECIPVGTIYNWMKNETNENAALRNVIRSQRKKELIAWYERHRTGQQTQQTGKPILTITLEQYLNTYDESSFDSNLDNILQSVEMLHQNGYVFPYVPKPQDAYMMGYVFGRGNIRNGKEKSAFDLTIRRRKGSATLLARLSTLQINKEHEYSSALGRLVHLLGFPIGNKYEQATPVPPWIRIMPAYQRHFMAGFLDAKLRVYARRDRIEVELCRGYNRKGELFESRKEILDQLKENGIEVHEKSWKSYPHRTGPRITHWCSTIRIKTDSDNVRRLIGLPMNREGIVYKQLQEYLAKSTVFK